MNAAKLMGVVWSLAEDVWTIVNGTITYTCLRRAMEEGRCAETVAGIIID